MLYHLVKIPARIALLIYCKKLQINNKTITKLNGPVLIACNHPNTFLDAIVLATIFKKPIYSLARGDAFKNNFTNTLLKSFNILPVYRISEGAKNLNNNYDTFSKCKEIFKKNGIVLIFSEGLCKNEWKLRPLKKGTARLVVSSWESAIDVTVIPTGINYHSFNSFGKHIQINFGNPIQQGHLNKEKTDGAALLAFNDILKKELEQAVIHIESDDKEGIKEKFPLTISPLKKYGLKLPAIIGKWIHAPFYYPLQKYIRKKTASIEFYDATLVGALFFLYPLFLLMIALCYYFIFGNWFGLLAFILLPFFAWSYIQLKEN